MSRDDPFQVRHRSIPPIGDSNPDRAIMNKFGSQVTTDLLLQWVLSGLCFHMQNGTEDAPVTTQGPLDDTKPLALIDNNSGVIVPLLFECNVAAHSTGTAIEAMLEADMAKKRFSAGTTAYVPRQMNGAASNATAANGTFYVTDGGDITALAKSAVPDTIELARQTYSEDAIADPAGAMGSWNKDVFNIRTRTPVFVPNPGSLCGHFGSATADVTGYSAIQFAQFDANLAW